MALKTIVHSVSLRTIEDVEKCSYMGIVITKDGGADDVVNARINKAHHVFHRLNKVWSVRNISRRTKLRVFSVSVKIVLLYGSET